MKRFILPIFILVALVQLYVPAKMIFQQEEVISTGQVFRFELQPYDPYDPFRGKYISLIYKENSYELGTDTLTWKDASRLDAYITLGEKENGFAKIESVSRDKPTNNKPYVAVRVRENRWKNRDGFRNNQLNISYPFNRFYMEESKAYPAEQIAREARRDSNQVAYALVSVKEGNAVIQNVYINDTPIAELAAQRNAIKEE